MSDSQKNQEERFKEGKTVPGTGSYQFYEPVLNEMAVKFKPVNENSEYCGKAVFRNILDAVKWQPMQFVACIYDILVDWAYFRTESRTLRCTC